MVQVKALHAYEGQAADELTLSVGDIIDNVLQLDGGWWEGDLRGKHGVFPGFPPCMPLAESLASAFVRFLAVFWRR
eukprot:m.301320 g.301320  ORF g.301320 m.301320 type:complete len:76 (-) comp55222_c0_seq1:1138-1365(-)